MTAKTVRNPNTVVCLFAYGDIYPTTFNCLLRDGIRTTWQAGRAHLLKDVEEKRGLRIAGVPDSEWCALQIITPHQDALIDRARAVTVKNILEQNPEAEVIVMIDHDIEWGAESPDYEGDLIHIARRAAETKGVCGAVVSKKAKHQGIALMWEPELEQWTMGAEGFHPVFWVGSAFTAYHVDALKKVTQAGVEIVLDGKVERVQEIPPGYAPIFMPMVVRHPVQKDQLLTLSEDWAFCHRAKQLGVVVEGATKPLITHWGRKPFTVIDDAVPPEFVKKETPAPVPGQQPVTISLIHATRGRPDKAMAAYRQWMDAASGQHDLEYIFSVDDDDDTVKELFPHIPSTATLVKGKSRGTVDATNRAAYASTGQILVQVHDDVVVPEGWDALIVDRIGDVTKPAVLLVNDGIGDQLHPDKSDWLVTIAIMTRPFAEKMGGIWYPGYPSVFCDDDMSRKAEQDGVLIRARDIMFKHEWKKGGEDDTYRRSYDRAKWDAGKSMFDARMRANFQDTPAFWGSGWTITDAPTVEPGLKPDMEASPR